MEPSRTPGQRAGLTRTAVLTAARSRLTRLGLTGLTMRGLAADLGVAPNAIYSHVTSKDMLIDELLDAALADVDDGRGQAGGPSDGLMAVMTSTFEMLVRQRDLVPLYLARQGARGPNAQRLGVVMTDLLAAAEVAADSRQPAVRVLVVYTIGFAAFAPPTTDGDPVALAADILRDNFIDGLGWLLAGILRG